MAAAADRRTAVTKSDGRGKESVNREMHTLKKKLIHTKDSRQHKIRLAAGLARAKTRSRWKGEDAIFQLLELGSLQRSASSCTVSLLMPAQRSG